MRAAPIRHRGLVAALLVVALAGGVVVPFATLANLSTTYRANVTFQYPAEWQDVTNDVAGAPVPDERWFTALRTTEADGVAIQALPAVVTSISADDLPAVKDETTPVIREVYEREGGSLQQEPVETMVAGLPALRYHGDAVFGGTSVEITRVQVFGTTEEYLFTCQYTRAYAAEITQGCEQILSTFAVESGSEHEAERA